MNTDFQYIQDSQPSEYRTLLFCSTPSKAFLAQLGKSLCPARPSTASAFYIENPPSTLPADFIAKLAIQAHGVFPDFKREKITSIIFKNTLRRAPKVSIQLLFLAQHTEYGPMFETKKQFPELFHQQSAVFPVSLSQSN